MSYVITGILRKWLMKIYNFRNTYVREMVDSWHITLLVRLAQLWWSLIARGRARAADTTRSARHSVKNKGKSIARGEGSTCKWENDVPMESSIQLGSNILQIIFSTTLQPIVKKSHGVPWALAWSTCPTLRTWWCTYGRTLVMFSFALGSLLLYVYEGFFYGITSSVKLYLLFIDDP